MTFEKWVEEIRQFVIVTSQLISDDINEPIDATVSVFPPEPGKAFASANVVVMTRGGEVLVDLTITSPMDLDGLIDEE